MRMTRAGLPLPTLAAPLLVLLTLAAVACSEGRPPSAPPPGDSSLIVSFSSDNASDQDQAAVIVIEILRIVARAEEGQDVDLGAPDDEIDLVERDDSPIELVGAQVEPGDFSGLEVEFAPEGFVRNTPASPEQDMTLTDTTVTASGDFSVTDGMATEVELVLDLDGRLTFDEETETWELDPRDLDLLN